MKKYFATLCFALLLASCSKSDEPIVTDNDNNNTMSFAAHLSDKEDSWSVVSGTRGAPINNATIQEFSAFCFPTGENHWADVVDSATPTKMFNQKVTRSAAGSNEWVYTPQVSWGGGLGSYFTFFGYSPHATGLSSGNNLEVTTTDAAPGVPGLHYVTLDDVKSQVDLLVAAPVYNTNPVTKVRMQFAHALSQIRFKAWSERNFVRVKSIEIKEIKYDATLTLASTATTAAAATKTFKLDNLDKTLSTNEAYMTDLSDGSNAFLLLPQDFVGNASAEIVVTYSSGNDEYKSVPYFLEAKSQNWEAGKSYTYTLKLGGQPTDEMIVEKVIIEDWVVDSEENMETSPPPYRVHPPTFKDYIEINGLLWTIGNLVSVNEKECKVGAPTDDGLYFRFGSLLGWAGGTDGSGAGQGSPATEIKVKPYAYKETPLWDASPYYITNIDKSGNLKANANEITAVGDPCAFYLGSPWRLPTTDEYSALSNGLLFGNTANWSAAGGVYQANNSVDGGWFNSTVASDPSALFIPTAGMRSAADGTLTNHGSEGYIWASNYDQANAHHMQFLSTGVTLTADARTVGKTVRCVSVSPPLLSISSDSPGEVIPWVGKTYTISLTSNTEWVAVATNCAVSQEFGKGDVVTYTITVPAASPASPSPRDVKVVFTTTDNRGLEPVTRTWSSRQEVPAPILTISSDGPQDVIAKEGKTFTISLTSNTAWKAVPTNCTVSHANGRGDVTDYIITVPATTPANLSPREVKVVFSTTENGGQTGVVRTWSAKQVVEAPRLTISSTSPGVQIPREGGSYTLDLSSNTTWKAVGVNCTVQATGTGDAIGYQIVVAGAPGAKDPGTREIKVTFTTTGNGSNQAVRQVWNGTQDVPQLPPEGTYIPSVYLQMFGWPAHLLPPNGIQVGMRGDKQPPLIGKLEDDDPEMQWSSYNETTGDTGIEIGDGKRNCEKYKNDDAYYAIQYCVKMSQETGQNWYLPSLKESNLLHALVGALWQDYAFKQEWYWTSSSTGKNTDGAYSVIGPTYYPFFKRTPLRVRCVREI